MNMQAPQTDKWKETNSQIKELGYRSIREVLPDGFNLWEHPVLTNTHGNTDNLWNLPAPVVRWFLCDLSTMMFIAQSRKTWEPMPDESPSLQQLRKLQFARQCPINICVLAVSRDIVLLGPNYPGLKKRIQDAYGRGGSYHRINKVSHLSTWDNQGNYVLNRALKYAFNFSLSDDWAGILEKTECRPDLYESIAMPHQRITQEDRYMACWMTQRAAHLLECYLTCGERAFSLIKDGHLPLQWEYDVEIPILPSEGESVLELVQKGFRDELPVDESQNKGIPDFQS